MYTCIRTFEKQQIVARLEAKPRFSPRAGHRDSSYRRIKFKGRSNAWIRCSCTERHFMLMVRGNAAASRQLINVVLIEMTANLELSASILNYNNKKGGDISAAVMLSE